MKYLLVEPKVKAIAPNIALMKWARWCEINGHEYEYIRGMVEPSINPDIILMSCIFSYYSKIYEDTIDFYLKYCKNIFIGGVFPTLNSKWFDKKKWKGNPFFDIEPEIKTHCGMHSDIESLTPKYDVKIISEDELYSRDKIVMYASRGCVNKCGYCAVPKLEGEMKSFKSIIKTLESARIELPEAKSVVLYDNNFTEHKYFDNIVDELKDFGLPIDIHGLHVEAFTEHHAKRFEELQWVSQGKQGTPYLRFSFDWMKYKPYVEKAYDIYMNHNIKASFFCYMLFNWIDSPTDFWDRIIASQEMVDKYEKGRPIFLFPQRFEPFMALKRNQYISKKWDKFAKERWNGKCTGEQLIRGVTRMYTHIHGFLPVTKSKNLFNWIGKNCDEFLERAKKMGTDKNYHLEKIKDAEKIKFECEINP